MSILYFTWFLVDLKAPGKEEGLWYVIEVEREKSELQCLHCMHSENCSAFAVSHCLVFQRNTRGKCL